MTSILQTIFSNCCVFNEFFRILAEIYSCGFHLLAQIGIMARCPSDDWTNDGLVYWSIFVSLGLDGLRYAHGSCYSYIVGGFWNLWFVSLYMYSAGLLHRHTGENAWLPPVPVKWSWWIWEGWDITHQMRTQQLGKHVHVSWHCSALKPLNNNHLLK